VAALVMPALSAEFQKLIFKTQYKKAHATFTNAVKLAQANLDMPVGCSYWENQPMESGCLPGLECTTYNAYGDCSAWRCKDGNPTPSNWNGPRGDCPAFEAELFHNVLQPVKFCANKSLANGCITTDWKGAEVVKKENGITDEKNNPGQDWNTTKIQNTYTSLVMKDGTIIMKRGVEGSGNFPLYAIDINGRKGPNKWGYDIFGFEIKGTSAAGITKVTSNTYVVEKGGVSGYQMSD
jgi:hypothetical protein